MMCVFLGLPRERTGSAGGVRKLLSNALNSIKCVGKRVSSLVAGKARPEGVNYVSTNSHGWPGTSACPTLCLELQFVFGLQSGGGLLKFH